MVFVQFLQANYLYTIRTIEEAAVASDVLSLSDVLNSEWRVSLIKRLLSAQNDYYCIIFLRILQQDRNLSKVALSYCICGLMLANEKPVTGWNPVTKPQYDHSNM